MTENGKTPGRPDVAVGWQVRILDHDYLNDGRDNVTVTDVRPDGVTLTPRKPWRSQGMVFRTMDVSWDRLEWSGNTAHLYRVGTAITSRSRPGQKILVKSFEFRAPGR